MIDAMIYWSKFQSAPLLRGAIRVRIHDLRHTVVSIRAPLARGDGDFQIVIRE